MDRADASCELCPYPRVSTAHKLRNSVVNSAKATPYDCHTSNQDAACAAFAVLHMINVHTEVAKLA